jgi:hypothetical protein
MHSWNEDAFDQFKPPPEVLAKCQQVLIADPTVPPYKMKKWCWEHELSFVWFDLVDTTDVSGSPYDEVAAFYFIESKDAVTFTLKFK